VSADARPPAGPAPPAVPGPAAQRRAERIEEIDLLSRLLGRLDADHVLAPFLLPPGELREALGVRVLQLRGVERAATVRRDRAREGADAGRGVRGRSGSPTSAALRTSSPKRIVTARMMPRSATRATRYSLPRMTNVAIPARFVRSMMLARRAHAFADSSAGAR
jgi:hypothetical protein